MGGLLIGCALMAVGSALGLLSRAGTGERARQWPAETAGPFDPRRFEAEFRTALRAIADSGRGLELNTRRLWSWVPQWWVEEGGRSISFGSDAHLPQNLADHFPEAVLLAEHFGFRPGNTPEALWTR